MSLSESQEPDPLHDGRAAAAEAGLTYFSPDSRGISRRRAGRGFSYRNPDGAPIEDAATLARIASLAIPPAWREVWICPDPDGHIQAWGHDAAGRKQYRYHPEFRRRREEAKFHHLIAFARGLPAVREKVAAAMHRPGLGREKVLATVVYLLETTMIRVGNREYARSHHSFGLTTLENEHVLAEGGELKFQFTGKSGKPWRLGIRDRRVARIVRACQELPGQHLFEYRDDAGAIHAVTSGDVNAWLHEATGADITAKDFRTWAGTVLAARLLHESDRPATAAAFKRQLAATIRDVSAKLGNTPAICRKGYIHPQVQSRWLAGGLDLAPHWPADPAKDGTGGLRAEEVAVLAFLQAVEALDAGKSDRGAAAAALRAA
ncbi:MAG: DNA topoisomerase IB [Caulobacteraceae bacterium]